MKRLLILMLSFLLSAAGASAEGVTLRTVSCFAGEDAAAGAYVELLHAYEEQTGNRVEDDSATSDEGWKTRVLSDFAVGNEPSPLSSSSRLTDRQLVSHRSTSRRCGSADRTGCRR